MAVLCDHDHAAGSAGQFYIDPGATLTAVKGGPISGPGVAPAGTPTVVESRSTSQVSLLDDQSEPVTSVNLTPGTWAVTAKASAVNFSSLDWATCFVTLTSGGTATNSAPFVGVGGADSVVSVVDVEDAATVPSGGATMTLNCDSSFANDVYIDPGATLTATKVAPTALSDVLIGQVALPDTGGQAKAVSTQKNFPAGAWRVRTQVLVGFRNPNNSWGGGRDFVRCTIKAKGASIDGGATELVSVESNIQQIVNAGSFTAKAPWTLILSCSHDVTNTTAGHWTVDEGAVQAINKGPIN